MCGIAGFLQITPENYKKNADDLPKAISALARRGPDIQIYKCYETKLGLAHARLSIIDTSSRSNQPMEIDEGRYIIVFNGEIYNYKNIRKKIQTDFSETFQTESDTEVILKAYKYYKEDCLNLFNGFFSFVIYDKLEKQLFCARDRMGIKPFFYTFSNNAFYFASELKSLTQFSFPKKIDNTSLYQYFQLSYIPAPNTIYKTVKKLLPGNMLCINFDGEIEEKAYYQIPKTASYKVSTYENAQKELKKRLEESVEKRLIADVPLGSFLSGGIDSSIIASIAAKKTDKLKTFSIGFKENSFFDETYYANLVAKKIKSEHTVFSIKNQDLYSNLYDVLAYIDEPFADSSALPVFILSKATRKNVTVALSGDGADELFAGYNKHFAEYSMQNAPLAIFFAKKIQPILSKLPQSRNSKALNLFRQLNRFADGAKYLPSERYYQWCTIAKENELKNIFLENLDEEDYLDRKKKILKHFSNKKGMLDTLYTDAKFVLPNDMLVKVDMMSMANSLEVRVPFLDHRVVSFAYFLPDVFKIDKKGRKKILKDAFHKDLPPELYDRPKKGFEVPMLDWFRKELKNNIINEYLDDDFIEYQGIFNPNYIRKKRKQLFSNNPGDIQAQMWALIVFQHWYKKYMS